MNEHSAYGVFSFDDLGDITKGRERLGEEMPVSVYRLFQFTMRDVMVEKYGEETMIEVFRESGVKAGKIFAKQLLNLENPFNKFVAELAELLKIMKIGILRVEKFDEETGNAVLTVGDDLDCSGLSLSGKTVCNYDEGFIAGILNEYTKKNYSVIEVDCWGTGSRVCRFDAKPIE